MGEDRYFTVSIILKYEENDKVKKITEKYLVKANSLTDVDAKIISEFENETLEYEIKSVTDSKIIKIIE